MQYQGKIALVTGSSRGIGKAIALRLGAGGATVVVHYKQRVEEAQATVEAVEKSGGKAFALAADLEEPKDIDGLFQQIRERCGKLDMFVSNAGASVFKNMGEYKPHHLQRSFALNVQAFVLGTQHAVDLMPSSGGRIVVLSSYGSQRTFATYANLGSAKAALETWVRFMANEYGPRGITVNAVSGGLIETDSLHFFYNMPGIAPMESVVSKIPRRRVGTADEMAAAAAFLLSADADYITGTTMIVDGGLSIVSPPFVQTQPTSGS